MRMTMSRRDIQAIEKGMKKYNVDEKGLLKIAKNWLEQAKKDSRLTTEQVEFLYHFVECVETYVQWMK